MDNHFWCDNDNINTVNKINTNEDIEQKDLKKNLDSKMKSKMKCTGKEQVISLFLFVLFNNPMTKSMNNLIKHK